MAKKLNKLQQAQQDLEAANSQVQYYKTRLENAEETRDLMERQAKQRREDLGRIGAEMDMRHTALKAERDWLRELLRQLVVPTETLQIKGICAHRAPCLSCTQ